MQDGLSRIKADAVSSDIYDGLLRCLERFPEYEVETKQASLHVVHGRAFLGVHPRKHALLVNIVLSRPIESERLKRSERVSASRFHNEIVLRAATELDDEFTGWLREAYALTG